MNKCGRETAALKWSIEKSLVFMDVPSEVGDTLKTAVQEALRALEEVGISASDADEFVRECTFEAWWDWQYEQV